MNSGPQSNVHRYTLVLQDFNKTQSKIVLVEFIVRYG